MKQLKLGALFLSTLLTGCFSFRDSPFSDQLFSPERNLNVVNQQALSINRKSRLRVAVIADSHQNYRDLDSTIHTINREPDIDFAVILGDFTNSGYNIEYDRYLESHRIFRLPVFVILGNHDAIGAGISLFKKVFGPYNFSIENEYYKFIFFNSNNLESPENFSPEWLIQEVRSTEKEVYIFTHISLTDGDRFSSRDFAEVLDASRVQMVISGHNHIFRIDEELSVLQLHVPRVEGNNYLIFEISPMLKTVQKVEDNRVEEFQL